ncbi:MAG: hypothetical protein HIU83_03265 [Proteobacteria bacterium]|nr:hypothetical protein [Pseudomonadota bacterium]
MSEKMMKKSKVLIAALLGTVMIAALTIWGCGTSGYDNPAASASITTTKTLSGNALVTAAELKSWIDEGKVNAPFGNYDRVVILDMTGTTATTVTVPVTPATVPPTYTTTTIMDVTKNPYNATGHIPGAQLIDGTGPLMANRAEGPFNITGSMVCTGKTMDTLIQQYGIDGNTTIVLTTTSGVSNVTRAYATFRYWGFPKNRLKVLNGGNAAWTAGPYALTKAVPAIAASKYSVAPGTTTRVNTDMRASLSEMIGYVKSIVAGNPNNVIILDTIRPATQITSTTDLLDSGNTPFEGAIKGSYRFPGGDVVSPTTGLYFKDADALKAMISAGTAFDNTTLGDTTRDAAKTFVTQCRAGNLASQAYFALDGIAYYDSNVDVKWYDGSYGQWNLCASSDHVALNGTNAGGKLAVGSIWDTTSLMDKLTWTKDLVPAKAVVDYGTRVFTVEPSFAEGNQVETADKAYRSPVTTAVGGGASGGGGC